MVAKSAITDLNKRKKMKMTLKELLQKLTRKNKPKPYEHGPRFYLNEQLKKDASPCACGGNCKCKKDAYVETVKKEAVKKAPAKKTPATSTPVAKKPVAKKTTPTTAPAKKTTTAKKTAK